MMYRMNKDFAVCPVNQINILFVYDFLRSSCKKHLGFLIIYF